MSTEIVTGNKNRMVYRNKSDEFDINKYIRDHLRDIVSFDTETILLLNLSIETDLPHGRIYKFGEGKREARVEIKYKPMKEDDAGTGVFELTTKKNKTVNIDLTIDSDDGWWNFNNYIIAINSVSEL